MLSTKNKSVHNNYFITMPFLVHYDNGFFFSWNSNVEGRWEKANLELFFFWVPFCYLRLTLNWLHVCFSGLWFHEWTKCDTSSAGKWCGSRRTGGQIRLKWKLYFVKNKMFLAYFWRFFSLLRFDAILYIKRSHHLKSFKLDRYSSELHINKDIASMIYFNKNYQKFRFLFKIYQFFRLDIDLICLKYAFCSLN